MCFVCVGMSFATVVEWSTVKDNRVAHVLCGGLLQEVYRGKQNTVCLEQIR